MLFADLDGLKIINDRPGHHQGDLAIVEAANILKKSFRGSDTIARTGGDEFDVFLLGNSEALSNLLSARLQHNFDAYNSRQHNSFKLALSIGSAFYNPEHLASVDELLITADKKMYEQKKVKNSSRSSSLKHFTDVN